MKKTNDRIRVIRVRRRTNPSSGGLSVVVIIFVIRVNSCRFVIKHQNKNAQRFRCSDRPVGGEEPSRDGS